MAVRAQLRCCVISASALLVSCGSGQQPGEDPAQAPMLRGTDNMQDFGAYVVYVNALLTDELDAGIAGEYGIVRSNNRALLTFSVHRKEENGVTSAVQSQVSSSAVNMTGQLKTVLLREISEDEAIYYIGELDVIHGETLIYTINATPHGESDRLTLRYQKQFFADL